MAPAQQSAVKGQIILHHLSDVRHEVGDEKDANNNVLVRYKQYLEGLPLARFPNIVVITGDLTTNGTREELNAVATTLRTCFARWAGSLNKRVVVVPGPHDVNWEAIDTVGLQPFYDIFSDFATPFRSGTPGGRQTPEIRFENFMGYPLDTCYFPNELGAGLQVRFKGYSSYYGQFVENRAKLGRRFMGMWKQPWRLRRLDRDNARRRALDRLRLRFLELTEGARLIDLHAGRINDNDVDRFDRWAKQQQSASAGGGATDNPLKVLITHHPVIIRALEDSAESQPSPVITAFKRIADATRLAGFHLALHGHIHHPELLADQSVFEGPDGERPLRRLGAASLGDTGIFNEITAVYRTEKRQGAWRLDYRLVDLAAPNAVTASPLEVLNRAEVADKEIKQLQRIANQRSEFERNSRYVMRRFAEQAYQGRPENRQNLTAAPLPQGAMLLVRDVVSSVIFKGYETRVRLLLKSKEDRNSPVPQLKPTYLDPGIMDGPGALLYPASVAAWALILGRPLIYPNIEKARTEPDDHEWLRRTNKVGELVEALKELIKEATAANASDAVTRYQNLESALEAIKGAGPGQNDVSILGEKMFQPEPSAKRKRSAQQATGDGAERDVQSNPDANSKADSARELEDRSAPGDDNDPDLAPAPKYSNFICVPYPLRSSGGAPTALPEIAVLDIGVRLVEQPDFQDSATMSVIPFNPFTKERIEMLEALTEFIGVMLVSADALGKPRGIWEPRAWNGM